MLKLPTNSGWYIEWTQGYKTYTRRDGKTITHPVIADYTNSDKAAVMRKKAELEAQGIVVSDLMECIY